MGDDSRISKEDMKGIIAFEYNEEDAGIDFGGIITFEYDEDKDCEDDDEDSEDNDEDSEDKE